MEFDCRKNDRLNRSERRRRGYLKALQRVRRSGYLPFLDYDTVLEFVKDRKQLGIFVTTAGRHSYKHEWNIPPRKGRDGRRFKPNETRKLQPEDVRLDRGFARDRKPNKRLFLRPVSCRKCSRLAGYVPAEEHHRYTLALCDKCSRGHLPLRYRILK